jgi:hypothetical protein
VFWCISWPPESSPSHIIFSRLGWLKTCFYAFAHTSRPPESGHWKIIFFTFGVVKTCFDVFPDHQNQVLQKLFFHVQRWLKRVFLHFHTTRFKSLKNYFLTSGVVQNVFLCICAYFQTTRIKSLKNYFFHLWSGQKRVLMHFLITRI